MAPYREVGDVLWEAHSTGGLGDVALARSDHDEARDRYEQALPLYRALPEPHLVGWMLVRLAQLDPSSDDRAGHWAAAHQAWAGIGRDDLVESIQRTVPPRSDMPQPW